MIFREHLGGSLTLMEGEKTIERFSRRFTMQEDMVADGLACAINMETLKKASSEIFGSRYQGDGTELINTNCTLKEVVSNLEKQYL